MTTDALSKDAPVRLPELAGKLRHCKNQWHADSPHWPVDVASDGRLVRLISQLVERLEAATIWAGAGRLSIVLSEMEKANSHLGAIIVHLSSPGRPQLVRAINHGYGMRGDNPQPTTEHLVQTLLDYVLSRKRVLDVIRRQVNDNLTAE